MYLFRLLTLVTACAGLMGCSWLFGEDGTFRERAMDYKHAKSIDSLHVPEGVASKEIKQRYPIPAQGEGNFYVPKASDDLPKPQALLNVNEDAGVELRSDGKRHWLEVNQSVDRLWPQVKAFLNTNGLLLDVENRAEGYQETRWLKPREREEDRGFWARVGNFFTWGKSNTRERFRLTFKQGPAKGGAAGDGAIVEINHLETRKSEASLPMATNVHWPDQPDNPKLVLVLYNELVDFLGEGGRQVSFSVLSQDLTALPKFVMTWDGNGYPVLVINQDFNRAWQDVGAALDKARLPVDDLDRSLGIYYLKQKVKVDDKNKPLQLRVARSESGIQVSVQFDDDNLAPKDESAAVLNRLREALE